MIRDGLPDARVVTVGALADGPGDPAERFVPYTDGGIGTVIPGFQGGYMVTPVVRVSSGGALEPTACYQIRVDNQVEGVELSSPSDTFVEQLALYGADYYSLALPDFLSFNRDRLHGITLHLDVTVTGNDFRSSASATLVLEVVE